MSTEGNQAEALCEAWAAQFPDREQPVMDHKVDGWGVLDVAWPDNGIGLVIGSASPAPSGWDVYASRSPVEILDELQQAIG